MVTLDRICAGGRLKRQQFFHLLGKKAELSAAFAAGREETVPQRGRQAVVQRAAAARVDVDAIALQPLVAHPIALVNRDADAGLAQSLREAKSADAATNDGDVEFWMRHGNDPLARPSGNDPLKLTPRRRRDSFFAVPLALVFVLAALFWALVFRGFCRRRNQPSLQFREHAIEAFRGNRRRRGAHES